MEPVRSGLKNIMSDILRTRPEDEAVFLAWPLVCGREVAERTSVVGFAEGKLTVNVTDPAWRAQLASFEQRYISEFAGLLGPLVQQIDFKMTGTQPEPKATE